MSWVIEIVAVPVADDPDEAWEQLDELREEEEQREFGTPPSPPLLELYLRLTARYPCITQNPNSPWSDGPLIENFGEKIATLGFSGTQTAEALPFVIETATKMGFTVFDGGDEAIHRPEGWKPPTEWSIPTPAPRRRLRLRLSREMWLWLVFLVIVSLVLLTEHLGLKK